MRKLSRTSALLVGMVAGFALLIGIGASILSEDKSLLGTISITFAIIVASLIPILSDDRKQPTCTAQEKSIS